MWFLRKPPAERIRVFLAREGERAYSYRAVGATRGEAPAGYDLDQNRTRLGQGRSVFDAASRAVRHWRMFPSPWTEIDPADSPIVAGGVVAVLAHVFGFWWLNACRIVYVIEEGNPTRRFGFAYGTLPGHVESGEERFAVEMDDEDVVWYDVRAFSRPRHWLVRLGYPLARRLQARFARESQAAMRRIVSAGSPPVTGGPSP
jgi:uncharacterized protein (UPF0548 family)